MKEQTFFDDPALDRILGVVTALAGEVYILRDRVRILEHLLAVRGVVEPGAVNLFEPTPDQQRQAELDRDAFIERVFDAIVSGESAASKAEYVDQS